MLQAWSHDHSQMVSVRVRKKWKNHSKYGEMGGGQNKIHIHIIHEQGEKIEQRPWKSDGIVINYWSLAQKCQEPWDMTGKMLVRPKIAVCLFKMAVFIGKMMINHDFFSQTHMGYVVEWWGKPNK